MLGVNLVTVSSVAGAHGGTQSQVDLIVMHGTVGPCLPGHSENIANYLNGVGYSVHEIVDPTTVTVMLPDHTIAYGDGTNTGHWQVELCDPQAGDPRRWFDDPHVAMLRNAAVRARAAAGRLGIPLQRVQAPLFGKRGICGHKDVSDTWHNSTHQDPDTGGPFPWDYFMGLVIGTPTKDGDMDEAQMTTYLGSSVGRKAIADALLEHSYFQPVIDGKPVPINSALEALSAKLNTLLAAVPPPATG